MALLYGTIGKYQEAIDTFDDVIKVALGSPLTKYSVKDHLFRAMLCSLCLKVQLEIFSFKVYFDDFLLGLNG